MVDEANDLDLDVAIKAAARRRRAAQGQPAMAQSPQLTLEQKSAVDAWARHNDMMSKHSDVELTQPMTPEMRTDMARRSAERAGWKAPEKAGYGQAVAAGTNDMAFGFGDELSAGMNAGASFLYNLPGKGVEGAGKKAAQTFDREMDAANIMMDKGRTDRPVTALAPIAVSALASLPVAARSLATRTVVPAATTQMGKIGQGAVTLGKVGAGGAAAGEVAGIGAARGNLPERVQDAGWEAPVYGAAAGYAGQALGKVVGAGIKAGKEFISPSFMKNPTDRAMFLLERAMKRDGVDMADLQAAQARVKNMGGDTLETLAELAAYTKKSTGKNLRGLARALHATPGRAGEIADQLIEKRRGALHTGASKAVAAGTGAKVVDYADTLSGLEQSLKTNSAKAYDAFNAAPVNPAAFESQIVPVLRAPHGRMAMEKAAAGLRVEAAGLQARAASGDPSARAALQRTYDAAEALTRASKALDTGPMEVLPPTALDHVKRAFDDLIDEAGQASYTGGNLRKAKNNFAESISNATGGTYAEALGTYSGGKRLRESVDIGYKAFNMKPWQLDQALEGTGPAGQLTQEEFEGVTLGFARALQDAIDGNDLAAVRKVLRDKGMQTKLRTVMGTGYSKFMSRVQRLVNRQEFDNFVSKGSPTARIAEEVDDATDEDVVTRVFDSMAAQGGAPSLKQAVVSATIQPAMKKAADLWRQARYRGIKNPKVNEELGRLMFSPMTDKPTQALTATMAARVPKPSGLSEATGAIGSTASAMGAGRESVPMNMDEERTVLLARSANTPMTLAYADPETSPEELAQIEELRAQLAQLAGQDPEQAKAALRALRPDRAGQ